MMSAAISFWQPMASMVTTAPLRSSSSSNSGMAVISLDLASVATCPKVRRFSTAQALTTCRAERPTVRRAEPRWALPSMAIGVSSGGSVAIGVNPLRAISAVIQEEKHFWKASGSSRQKTRRKVSCEGMPPGKVEEGLEPVELGVGVVGDLHPVVGAAEDGAGGDEDDLVEAVDSPLFAAGIGEVGEMVEDRGRVSGPGKRRSSRG